MSAISNESIYDRLGLTGAGGEQPERIIKKNLDQADFLKLLSTQLQNQDPLKPLDNNEFIAQMAQFSSVESLQKLQSSFDGLANSMTSNQALQASALVGRSVLIKTDTGVLGSEGGVGGYVDLPANTSNVRLTVRNAAGETVSTLDAGNLPKGEQPFAWDGKDNAGNKLPPGPYEFIVSGQSGGKTETFITHLYNRVDSVNLSRNGEGITLNILGMGKVPLSDVRQIG